MHKIYSVIALSTIFFLNVVTAFAQVPCPGDPSDPGYDPNNCPLDTWVIMLAAAAILFTTLHLYRKHPDIITSA